MQQDADKAHLGERTLWLHVLRDAFLGVSGSPALDKAQLTHAARKKLVREDRRWFLSPRDDTGSFRWVCAALGLDADTVVRLLDEKGLLSGGVVLRALRGPERTVWADHYSDGARGARKRRKTP